MLNSSGSSGRRSSIFRPSGQIGLICDGRAFCLNNLGTTSFVIASTLRQFVVYEALSLKLTFISLPLKCTIKSIAALYENVFLVLEDDSVYSFHKYDHREVAHRHESPILGAFHHDDALVTYSSSELITYSKREVSDGNSSTKWELNKVIPFDRSSKITTVLPLEGFSNKALVGLSDSTLALLNLKSAKVLYKFSSKVEAELFKGDSHPEGVQVLSQSRNRSSGVVAVGYKCSYVSILDINKDESLGGFRLSKEQKEPCSLSFVYDHLRLTRKQEDSLATPELLVVGTVSGDLVVFDLYTFTVISCIEAAHTSPVRDLMYIESHKYLLSTGENSLIAWNMDSEKAFLRELKSRRGFVGKINHLLPYDVDENDILICSTWENCGYLAKVSTIQQHQSVAFSTKAAKTKLRKITGISASYQRHYDWPNIVTCHSNSHHVRVWSGFRGALIDSVLRVPDLKCAATAVCLTKCGNYAVVGYENGQVHVFTLQNCNYDSELLRELSGQPEPAHASRVINISLLGNSKILTLSNSKEDHAVRVWDLMKLRLDFECDPEIPAGHATYMATSGNFLTALACTDSNVYLVDVAGKLIIRKISYPAKITSMTFHKNDAWLVLATENSTMLVYDILSDCYVDYAKFSGTPLSLSIDQSGSLLLVANEKHPGMILQYTNKHAFELFPKSILYRDRPSRPIQLDEPAKDADTYLENEDNLQAHSFESTQSQIEHGIITLSGISSSKLQNILFLDQIKEKSKPVQPRKHDDDLPFFIPTTYKDGQLVFVDPVVHEPEPDKRIDTAVKAFGGETAFGTIMLLKRDDETKYQEAMDYLKNLTPSGVHLAISMLLEGIKDQSLSQMLDFFHYHAKKRTDADALQVYIYTFLKAHGDTLYNTTDNKLRKKMEYLKDEVEKAHRTLEASFDRLTCHIKIFTHLKTE